MRGYKRALKRHGIVYQPDYVQNGDYTAQPDLWRQSTRTLLGLPEPPTAIVASDDTVAAVVLETLRRGGVDVPGEISVIGVDDQPSLAFLGLTTVKLPIVQTGKHAIELLIRRIADRHAEVRHVTVPCQFIERSTSGPPRADLAPTIKHLHETSRRRA